MLRPLVALLLIAAAACSPGETAPQSLSTPAPEPAAVRPAATSASAATDASADEAFVLLAVGDIAACTTAGDEKVARLVRRRTAPVALLGDIVYPSGTPQQFRDCFDPAWGSMRDRLHPVPGNHEYKTPDARGYFGYFDERAGRAGRGWYAFDLGEHWRVFALNSNCWAVGGCTKDSPQGRWLQRKLAAAGDRHILAFWHAPRFNSGRHGNDLSVAPFWRALSAADADIVLNGHEHIYERFAPQNARGRPVAGGIRQFTVGTGGYVHYALDGPKLPATQVRNDDSFGVLRLRLEPDGYRWRFLPATGSFTDRGIHRLR